MNGCIKKRVASFPTCNLNQLKFYSEKILLYHFSDIKSTTSIAQRRINASSLHYCQS